MQATSPVATEPLGLNETSVEPAPSVRVSARTIAQRGQMLVVFVMAIFVIIGLVGIVIDISWYWTNTLRVQRAADAAALAGAVQLPSLPGPAVNDAQAQAGKNGYPSLALGCAVSANVDPSNLTPASVPGMCARQNKLNKNQMDVSISAPVGTFFMRVFGIQNITATRSSKALYTLPVPMGSPENYFGVFGDVRNATMTTTVDVPVITYDTVPGPVTLVGPKVATTSPAGTPWTVTPTSPVRNLVQALATDESSAPIYYAQTATNNATQQLGEFGIQADIPPPDTSGNPTTAIEILGVRVLLDDARLSGTCSNSRIRAHLSWNGGTSWSSSNSVETGNLSSPTANDYGLGSAYNPPTLPSMSAWGNNHTWDRGDFSDGNFRLRLTAIKGCTTTSRNLQVDQVRVNVWYRVNTTTATTTLVPDYTTSAAANYPLKGPGAACLNGATDCFQSKGSGQALNPRGFWATMNTQGAANVNGDAYQPFYDNPTSTPAQTCPSAGNACYDPLNYYNYAVKMPASTSNGRIFIFDPVFCETSPGNGTGDRWFGGSNPVSTWYEVYTDPNNTPYDISDDSLLTSSGSRFESYNDSDLTMDGTSPVPAFSDTSTSDCRQWDRSYGDSRDYHNSWYLLASGLAGGVTYRVHTTSSGPVSQTSTNGEQSFAIFADNAEGQTNAALLPQVYGMGAMQMFTPLQSSGGTTNSTFYLAQVPEFYAGKILEISLWDPGDTNPLAARLYIERPTSSGWTDAYFTYSAKTGTTGGANSACNSNSNSSSTNLSVLTNVGATTGLFNGCWLTLTIPIPTTYGGDQDGWWRIRYAMTGSGTSNDVTTWTASIKGNPVHLVVP